MKRDVRKRSTYRCRGFDLLEERRMLAHFRFDYSRDENRFFSQQERRDILELAGETLADRIEDDLLSIIPSGGNTWQAVFSDPATGNTVREKNVRIARGEILVFAGGRNLPGDTVGRGGGGGFTVDGSSAWENRVQERGQSGVRSDVDVARWGGAITFDTNTDWHFGVTTNGLGASETDFYSVALHELGHLLGLFRAESAERLVSDSKFRGANARSEFGSSIPMTSNEGHFADGTRNDGRDAAMDPIISNGTRKTFTNLDWAALDDIGYEITASTTPRAGMFSARVIDANGRPVSNVTITGVTYYSSFGFEMEDRFLARTNARGYANVFLPRGGQWTLNANGRGVSESRTMTIVDEDVNHWLIRLSDGFSLTGSPVSPEDGVLRIAGNNGGAGNDAISLHRNGSSLVVTTNGAASVFNLSLYSRLVVDGGDGNDKLTIDYSGGDPLPAEGLFFDGGSQGAGGDELIVVGTNIANAIFSPAGPGAGSISLGGSFVSFTDIEKRPSFTLIADRFESNNGRSTATDKGVVSLTQSITGETDELTIHNSADTDWFRFDVRAAKAAGSIVIALRHGDGDLDARLHRLLPDGTLEVLALSASTGDRERFDRTLDPGTYYVEVFGYQGATNSYSMTFDLAAERNFVVTSADAGGGPHVRVLSPDGRAEQFGLFAYDINFRGGVRVATGDVNGDGVPDVITAPGRGGGPHIRVFDGVTGTPLPGPVGSFFAFSANFTGGVHVASGDFNGDGFDDIVTSADAGGGPHVRVFSGWDGAELASFFAYAIGFSGGVRVAVGDVNGDGNLDLITSPGPSGGPHIRVFSGLTGVPIDRASGDFFAYQPGFTGGVFVTSADLNGDGYFDIVTGADAGGGPHVRGFDARTGHELVSFMAYDQAFTGGVRVTATDVDGDGRDDIITSPGPGGGPHIRAFRGTDAAELSWMFAFSAGFLGGAFVAGHAPIEAQGEPIAHDHGSRLEANYNDLARQSFFAQHAKLTDLDRSSTVADELVAAVSDQLIPINPKPTGQATHFTELSGSGKPQDHPLRIAGQQLHPRAALEWGTLLENSLKVTIGGILTDEHLLAKPTR